MAQEDIVTIELTRDELEQLSFVATLFYDNENCAIAAGETPRDDKLMDSLKYAIDKLMAAL